MTAQVTALSTKLLEAIDKQADLEDQIQVMRKELDHTRRENMRFEDRLKSGELVNKSMFVLEKAKREAAEQQVAHLQGEIEELTSSLFDEANKMVAQANRETNDREKRNDQLVQQLKERDVLLENMQEQLSGLKMVLQAMTDQQNDFPSRADDEDTDEDLSKSVHDLTSAKSIPLVNASVYRPVVRHDLQSFNEFLMMIPPPPASPRTSMVMGAADSSIASGRASPAPSTLGEQSSTGNGPSMSPSTSHTPTGSTTNVTSTGTSNLAALTSRFQSLSTNTNSNPGLKDFKFFKRSLSDDIEPTLHLETAPGLSWLSRRNIMSSILDGSIVVEPIAAANEGYKLMVAGAEAEELPSPEYVGLTRTISGGSTTTVQATTSNGGASVLGSYMPLSQASGFIASSSGQKIKTTLTGSSSGSGAGAPVATRTPCALCGEKRDNSLLYARLHNLRGYKEMKKEANSGKETSISTSHGYHKSTDSISSHVTMNEENSNNHNNKSSIDNNNGGTTSISIDNDSTNGVITTTNTSSGSGPDKVSSGYPLCFYCLNRVRSVCDYVSFVRSIRAGLWKIEDESGQMRAWEECVHLRERMFWSRNGGYFVVGDNGQPVDARTVAAVSGSSTGGGVGGGAGGLVSRGQVLSRVGSKNSEEEASQEEAEAEVDSEEGGGGGGARPAQDEKEKEDQKEERDEPAERVNTNSSDEEVFEEAVSSRVESEGTAESKEDDKDTDATTN